MNELAFQLLKERGYKNILFVSGNHDLYMLSKNQSSKYGCDSFTRLEEMVNLSKTIEGVHYINGNVVSIDGLNVGGIMCWYDLQFGVVELGLTIQHLTEVWKHTSNDSRLINVKSASGTLDNLALFKDQYALLKNIYKQCDVVMTHIGPDWSHVDPVYKEDPVTSFYYFDGRNLLASEHKPKLWLFGHTHNPCSYLSKYGVRMECNPLGYPLTSNWQQGGPLPKIKTIEVEK